MHREVDEEIDAIGADYFRQLRRLDSENVVPDIGRGAHSSGDFIRPGHARVGVDFDLRAIVGAKEREEKKGDGVRAKIR